MLTDARRPSPPTGAPRLHLLAAALLGLASIIATTLPTRTTNAQAEAGFVHGVVFDGDTHDPLHDVAIDASGTVAGTTPDGGFQLRLPAGTHRLVISAAGYPTATVDVEVVLYEVSEALISLYRDGRPPHVQLEVAHTSAETTATSAATTTASAALGQVSGTLRHSETGRPVREARIVVRGDAATATSDVDGHYTLALPPGTWELTVIHPDHAPTTIPAVSIESDATTALDLELSPASVELEEFSVSAPRIEGSTTAAVLERKSATTVSDILGAEQMARAGDGDAAAALGRVTGVTVTGGRYVYVRGLGDRYGSTLLDGATLPSPEPEKRVVPMDLFPTAVLESVVVQKTWTPDMPGEFAGGVVKLRTRRFPEQLTASVSVSSSARLGTTFEQGLHAPGGALDLLGIDGGERALPTAVRDASDSQPLLEADRFATRGYTAEQLEALGESMSDRWSPERSMTVPNLGFSATLGDRLSLGELPVGYLVGVTWGNDWSQRDRDARIYTLGADGLELAHRYDFEELDNTITLSAMANAGVELSRHHSLANTFLLARVTDSEARIYEGPNRDVGTDIRVTRLRWLERMLISDQLSGEHTFGGDDGLKLGWRYGVAFAFRDEPDRREFRQDLEQGTDHWLLSDRPEGNQRVFSDLLDQSHDVGLELTSPFPWLAPDGERKPLLEIGTNLVLKQREVDTRRYKFQHKGALTGDPTLLAQSPEDIFTTDHIRADGFQFEEITRQTDNYRADQQLLAAWLMAELPLPADVDLVAGARLEYSAQNVETFELFNPDNAPVGADLQTTDLLPALLATWSLRDDVKLRAGASITVSRPDFRELSPATFNDVTGGRQVFGNPDLQRATLYNGDLRAEYYPSDGESLSLSFFAKRFDQPIESVVVVAAQHSVSWANARGATNLGAELEARINLAFIHPYLRDLSIAGNATLVRSRVELDPASGIQTSSERPLQGQAPWVLNAELAWDDPDLGTTLVALYNVTGPRIDEVGALGAPDVILEPLPTLDLTFKQRVAEDWTLSAEARNLLDPALTHTQGGQITEATRAGRSFGVGVSRAF